MALVVNTQDFTIMVVDDVLSNVILLKALLTKEKYNVVTMTDGHKAIEMLRDVKPDLLLLDVMMPDISGYEMAKIIRTNPLYQDLPIIFLTVLNSSSDIVEGFKYGGNDYISKPFNREELLIRINHQLALVSAKRTILKQTEELKNIILGRDKLYSVIAHDLRSPLGSIKMVLNMVISNIDKTMIGEEMYDFLHMANQTAENTFNLLDNLLKWTKSQVGKLNIVYQNADIVEIVATAVDSFKLIALIKKIELNLIASGSIEVRIDVDMIKTVLRNLLSNAIKYSKDGGDIVVTVTDEADFAKISVKDCGVGIKKEDQDKIFNLYSQFSTFGTANEEGSGLGLLLVYDFVTKNGGKVWFDSTEGKGSTFYFTVPKKVKSVSNT